VAWEFYNRLLGSLSTMVWRGHHVMKFGIRHYMRLI
jgi:hypothetical protein